MAIHGHPGPGKGEPTGPVQSVRSLAGLPLWPEGSAGSTADCQGAGKGLRKSPVFVASKVSTCIWQDLLVSWKEGIVRCVETFE
jgi:hypothetical protein